MRPRRYANPAMIARNLRDLRTQGNAEGRFVAINYSRFGGFAIGQANPDRVAPFLDVGADSYFRWPIGRQALVARIEGFLRLCQRQRNNANRLAPTPSAEFETNSGR